MIKNISKINLDHIIPKVLIFYYALLSYLLLAYRKFSNYAVTTLLDGSLLTLVCVNLFVFFYFRNSSLIQERSKVFYVSIALLYFLSIGIYIACLLHLIPIIFVINERIFILQIVISILIFFPCLKSIRFSKLPRSKYSVALIVLSVTYVVATIFIYLPIQFYVAGYEDVKDSIQLLLKENLVQFALWSLGISLILLFPKRWHQILMKFSLMMASIVFLYTTIFKGNFGLFDKFFIMTVGVFDQTPLFYFLEGVLLVLIVFIIWKFALKKMALFCFIMACFHISSLIETSLALVNLSSRQKASIKEIQTTKNILPPDHQKIVSFSKNGNNIVVILLDMMTGGLLQKILEESPEMKEKLSGFIWYPNTLTITDTTVGSIPSIVGGRNYIPEKN